MNKEEQAIREAIDEVRGWYPEDLFPDPEGPNDNTDRISARMARMTCDNIKEAFERKLRGAKGRRLKGIKRRSDITEEQLNRLCKEARGELIDSATTYDDFRAAFTNESLPKRFKPIRWVHEEQQVKDLMLFLGIIKGDKGKTNKTGHLLVWADGTPIHKVTGTTKTYNMPYSIMAPFRNSGIDIKPNNMTPTVRNTDN